jgi:hypothetical protein
MKKMFAVIALFYSLPAFAEATKKQCYKITEAQINPPDQASLFPPYDIMCHRNTGSNPDDISFSYTHGEFSFFKINEANSTAKFVISLTIPYQSCSKGFSGFEIMYGINSSELLLLTKLTNNFAIVFSGSGKNGHLFIGLYNDENSVGTKYNLSMLEDELFTKYNL